MLSNVHGTFSKKDHMIGHKTSFNKFRKTESISRIFSDFKGLKLEPTSRKKLKNIQIHGDKMPCY